MQKFSAGDTVLVIPLQKVGCIVEAGRAGEYRVEIGSITMSCKASDLRPVEKKKSPKKTKREKSHISYSGGRSAPRSIDLHGMNVPQALAEVDKALDQALLAERDRLEVIHGIGTGALKRAIHSHLQEIQQVKRFALMAHNPGTTIIYL